MLELLAALSASAAGGIRVALPLLILTLLESKNFWSGFPLLAGIPPVVILAFLTSLTLIEIIFSKTLLGQRALQLVWLLLSPIEGAVIGIAVTSIHNNPPVWLIWNICILGGLLALTLQLVQAVWFYRLRGTPLWFICVQEVLCISLVIFALYAPQAGGLIALILLWLAVRSFKQWLRLGSSEQSPFEKNREP